MLWHDKLHYDTFRYLLDVRWFKQWKKYVGFESWDQQQMGSETAHPGPVDTSCLFKGYYSDVMIVLINILL